MTHALTAGTGKPCLLAVSFWVPSTGFTRVLESVFYRLADRFDVHIIGIGYRGPVIEGPVTVYPCNLKGGDMFGVYQAGDFIRERQPAIVFLLNDIWLLEKYLREEPPYRGNSHFVCYCPLDGRVLDEQLVAPVATMTPADRFVLYTEFARQEVVSGLQRLSADSNSLPGIEVVPHGVDTEMFYPLSGSIERQLEPAGRVPFKRRVFADTFEMQDSFVVLNANRPQPRKRIDLTLHGFAMFAQGKPENVRLVLHEAVAFGPEREELMQLAGRLGIAERVTMSTGGESGASNEELNLLYNACDVGVNTSMGEGWGLVSFEHAATGAAQVAPNHSACGELWAGSAEMLEPFERYVPPFALLELAAVTPEAVAATLERLYADRQHRAAMSLASYRNATRPEYRWERVAEQWGALFEAVMAGDGGR